MRTLPEAKQLIVDNLIGHIITDINKGDSTVLNELLLMLHPQTLVVSLPEEEWAENFKIAEIDKARINQFIKDHGTKVRAKEKDDYVDLMMDDHICIQWDKSQYYIPENVVYGHEDSVIWGILNEYYHV